uniref:Initiator Rep protein WH1 domain-containing protein n=2 Tax=Vibrio TaxID=662 RepID=A0A0H3ZYH8_9VIBR|nr:Phage protein [Vibrio genomosp. F6]AKN37754.1 hypothetical protein [Vibrio tasmaniensis]AKN39627.1 hypothetical protein [Vibrio tasmaniensis]
MEKIESGTQLTVLDVNSKSTVQANALLRLGVFVPVKRSKRIVDSSGESIKAIHAGHSFDASDEFRTLQIVKREGYQKIQITGLKLNFDTDFKVWCGIVQVFNKEGYRRDGVSLPFKEFAKMCGFSSKRMDSALRDRISESLVRIRNQTIRFDQATKSNKDYIGGLLSAAEFDVDADYIELFPDPKLWELYQIDHQVLVQLKAMNKLPRQEAAQCLYVFLCALPTVPHPISFTRLRERMQLTSSKIAEQNRTITTAIKKLVSIGYLQCDVVKKGNERFLIVVRRCPKLSLRPDSITL